MREESIPDEVPALFGAKVATEVLLSPTEPFLFDSNLLQYMYVGMYMCFCICLLTLPAVYHTNRGISIPSKFREEGRTLTKNQPSSPQSSFYLSR